MRPLYSSWHGTTKPIEQVRAGDLVKSRDPKTGVTEARRVLQTTVRQTDAVLALSLEDPKTGRRETITTTGEHPFYVNGKGFVKAGDLGIGTSLVTRAGPALTLSAVAWQAARKPGESLLAGKSASFTVYNLIVEGDHTYFVGTAGGGAWVHNVDCARLALANTVNRTTGVAYDAEGYPVFTSQHTVALPEELRGPSVSDGRQMRYATRNLRDYLESHPGEQANYNADQMAKIKSGDKTIPGFRWHHHQNGTDLELVDEWTHSKTHHYGGRYTTGGRP